MTCCSSRCRTFPQYFCGPSPNQFRQLSQSESLRRREEETHRHVQMQLQEQLHASIKTLTARFGSEKSELQRAAGQSQQELADLLSQYRDR